MILDYERDENGDIIVEFLEVHPDFEGKGIATNSINYLIEKNPESKFFCLSCSKSIGFWEKFNRFEIIDAGDFSGFLWH